ncbi:MAG TPA: molybdopterin-dependent oxidoreductase [Candidatus Acidoferrum sp.]|nr:molybdopterin-dependent oxidoreductase [Candidatus Acidoferrum sp.]
MSSKKEQLKDKELPPGQTPINRLLRWGIDHPGITRSTPRIDLKTYTLTIDGEVERPLRLRWEEIEKLPRIQSTSNFHCVEGWSVIDCQWEGVKLKELADLAKPKKRATAATFECADGYTTSLTLEDLYHEDVLLAYRLNEKPLEEGYGFPLRLVVPAKYGYKSALWVTRVKFTSAKEKGYWEKRGYSDTADVWKNDRFS